MRLPEIRDDIGFAVEPFVIFATGGELDRQHLQSVSARRPRMLNEVDLAHAARPE